MPELISILDQDTIARKVADVAQKISKDYQNGELVIVGVLKGALVFMADLIRQLTLKCVTIDFVRISSYGNASDSSGEVKILYDLETDIQDKDILIVDDILDTGLTLAHLIQYLQKRQPRSIKICTLIDKFERRQNDIKPDYVCHKIDQGFLVGYGLDYAEAYRNLPGLFTLKL